MEEKILLLSDDGLYKVVIDNGELISFQKNTVEYIHQKENKGWNSSDTEMFPVIGPTVKNNYVVTTKKGNAILDQHGLLREFEYYLKKSTNKTAVFRKDYQKNTPLLNRKYTNKSKEPLVFWPYDFSFEKRFTLHNNTLQIDFEIQSEKNMPFMLGYHPAFELSGKENEFLVSKNNQYHLKSVFDAGASALPILNTNEIVLNLPNKESLKVTTKGFSHFMLWTEVSTMLCIEPITHYPELETQKYSEENMFLSTGKDFFSVSISIEEV